ncbi:MAG: VaFE repeat-containing surface-anchored protein, partial [Schaedlerella sp.]|uniref:VaFE repeat-containing surface-anchored protein n=1 Tax=Schaedlerella sp. TaxID=2676057 RepID=UPI003527AB3D
GSTGPAAVLLALVTCDENGNAAFKTDIPIGARLYVQETSTDSHYVLPEEKYLVEFVYAGQDTALVEIKANEGEAIGNDLIYGTLKGLKIDRETEETIEGALFGLFKPDENDYTESTAILTARSQEDGIFMFENVPYGDWVIRELAPAEGFLPNTDLHHVQVGMDEQVIEITVVNDRIPEIGTKAEVDGEKEICATEVFALTDTVSYEHLIPGKEYVLKGTLMDKKTGKPLLINGGEIHAETAFTPDEPSGEVTVEFTFDSKYIKEDTDIVVFESLQRGGMELAVHADLTDEGQTVQVKVPGIGTKATIEGKKEITANGNVTIEDVVSYKNLTPGKEYTINGILMDKATGKELLVNGDIVTSGVTFIPEQPDGEVTVSFTFDASGLTKETEIVVFETLYREGTELAVHADIEDEGQTVTITPPAPDVPKTGDEGSMGFWIGLGAIALGGIAAIGIIYLRQKKDDGNE